MKFLLQSFLITLLALASCSCSSQLNIHSKAQIAGPLAPASRDSAEFAQLLTQKPWCSNDDAASMILLLVDGEDFCTSFEQRLVALELKGLADTRWDLKADKPVTNGTLAFMLCRALDIKGGPMMRLFPCRRYAYREAAYNGIIIRGAEYEPLTGREAVGIMGRAARFNTTIK
jgi:hypothetical protein